MSTQAYRDRKRVEAVQAMQAEIPQLKAEIALLRQTVAEQNAILIEVRDLAKAAASAGRVVDQRPPQSTRLGARGN